MVITCKVVESMHDLGSKDMQSFRIFAAQLGDSSEAVNYGDLAEVTRMHYLFVARNESSDNQLVGMAIMIPVNKIYGKLGRIEDIAVLPGYSEKDVGDALVRCAVKEGVKLGITKFEKKTSVMIQTLEVLK